MRQHIITSSNVYGIQASTVSAVAIVAARNVSPLGMRREKPLCKCLASSSKHRKDHSGSPVVSVVDSPVGVVRRVKSTVRPVEVMERSEASASRSVAAMTATHDVADTTSTQTMAWPASAAFAPPAVAWARFVIQRAISL